MLLGMFPIFTPAEEKILLQFIQKTSLLSEKLKIAPYIGRIANYPNVCHTLKPIPIAKDCCSSAC